MEETVVRGGYYTLPHDIYLSFRPYEKAGNFNVRYDDTRGNLPTDKGKKKGRLIKDDNSESLMLTNQCVTMESIRSDDYSNWSIELME